MGKYNEIIELSESRLKIFPNELDGLHILAIALVLTGDQSDRPLSLCEQAVNESKSNKARATSMAILFFIYKKYGMIEKAEKLARSLPHARESRELLLPAVLTQPNRDAYLRENLPGILHAICKLIDGGEDISEHEICSLLFGTYRDLIDPAEAVQKIAGFLNKN
jgi:hypothetical protein